ncbi:hypothetical protein AB0A63_39310 [Lentzea sp. NPDC042327]|uniref:hypothetical protein n=1 Tax=Lentzea sp. NPDC042327 TaxID=3154801 RepID=UPI0033F24727
MAVEVLEDALMEEVRIPRWRVLLAASDDGSVDDELHIAAVVGEDVEHGFDFGPGVDDA